MKSKTIKKSFQNTLGQSVKTFFSSLNVKLQANVLASPLGKLAVPFSPWKKNSGGAHG
jgi:hypothetical protein